MPSQFPSSDSSSNRSHSPSLADRKRKAPDSLENDPGSIDTDAFPVLSHAERRRQRKRARLALKEGLDPEPERVSKKKQGVTDKVARNKPRQNSVWVGNLSFKTTLGDLKAFFDGAGEITRVHMPLKPGSSHNRGFAYVDFATPEAKTVAITLSENTLLDRPLLIKDGDDFTGRPSTNDDVVAEGSAPSKGLSKSSRKILNVQKQPPSSTLFLGNLGFETTEESIRQLFEAHRTARSTRLESENKDIASEEKDVWLRKIRMGTFEDSGRCKGWAFADFSTTEEATAVLVNPKNHHLNGRDIVLEYASPEATRRGGVTPKAAKRDTKEARTSKNVHRSHMAEAGEGPAGEPGARSKRPRDGGETRQRRAKPALPPKPSSAAIVKSQGKKITF